MEGTRFESPPRLARLDWECEHFGFPVARLDADSLGDEELHVAFEAARRQQLRLVVLVAGLGRHVPARLLTEFDGALTDRKATFTRSLEGTVPPDSTDRETVAVVPYELSTVAPALLDLAIASGVQSRFCVDPRFPRDRFVDMYRIWIEGSVRGEIADAVLIAVDAASPGGLGGFVTVAARNGEGKIGLIAVAQQARGQGVGRRLVAAAHRRMLDLGARQARVVTQLANEPACGLYRRCGYELATVEHYYHFWPLAAGGAT